MQQFIDKLISRLEERKEFHNKLIAYEQKNGTSTEEYQQRKAVDVLDNAISIVNQLAEEYKGGWIPCDKEMPEFYELVLITNINLEVQMGSFVGDYQFVEWGSNTAINLQEIRAWMPLPEPYQKGE